MRNLTAALLISFFLLPATLLYAEALPSGTEEESAPLEKEPEGEDEEEEPGFIDVTHGRVSEAILASARRIDAFFSDERVVREETETRIRVGITNFTEEGDLFRTDLRTNIRLDLPLVGERLRLFFSRDEDGDRALFSQDDRLRQPIPATRDRQASIGLRYFLISTLRNNASLSTGLRFRGGSPVLLLEPRYRHTAPLDDDWALRFTQRFGFFSDGDLEVRTSFDVERPVREKFFFRTTAEGAWFKDEDGYFYGLHFTLYQTLSRHRMLQYAWSNVFVTRPTHALEEIRLLVAYRQKIWRDWMFVEVSPQIAFPREENYEISPGILLRLDIVFGDFRSLGVLF